MLNLTRATLRPDLAILTMAGYLDARPRVGYFYTGKTGSQLLTEKIKKIKVHEFQSLPVVIQESASVYDAITTMFLEDVGTLFVVDKNSKLAGVVSRKDLLRASIGQKDLNKLPVNVIMTRMPNIAVCYRDDYLIDVARRLIERQIDAMPVVKKSDDDSGYEVIGRVTKTNMTRALVEIASDEII